MILDDNFVADGLIKAKTCLYEGISLNEYSRDELIAIAVEIGKMYTSEREQSRSSMNLMLDLHRAERGIRNVP